MNEERRAQPRNNLRNPLKNKIPAAKLSEKVKCSICLDLLKEPMRPNCPNKCTVSICKEHVVKIQRCPLCRCFTDWVEDTESQNKLESNNILCDCGQLINMRDIEDHQLICSWKTTVCPSCGFTCKNDELMKHLYKRHYFDILVNFKNCVNPIERLNSLYKHR